MPAPREKANRPDSDRPLPAAEKGLQADPVLTPYYRRPFVWFIALVVLAIVIVTLVVLTSQQNAPVQNAQKPATPAANVP